MKLDKTLDYAPEHLAHLDYICGIDEVGRGCGAGPVVTAAVVLPKGFKSNLLRDSKKLNDKQKKEAYDLIMDNAIVVSCKMGLVSNIDTLGINQATFNAMIKNIGEINNFIKSNYNSEFKILLDGTVWDKTTDIKVELVPKGDDTYMCIAAAAIVAKVRRDKLMEQLHLLFPSYGWDSNKGYLTEAHIKGLKEKGPTEHHRKEYIKKFI